MIGAVAAAADIKVPSSYIEGFMAWKKGNRLRLVREREAQGRTKEVYEDIKATLGLPHISLFFQSYAAYSPMLELHWTRLRPIVSTQEFFLLASRLRADAYTRMHNYFDIPDLCAQLESLSISPGGQQEINLLIDLFHYANPLLLLMQAAQLQAFDGPVGQQVENTTPSEHSVFENAPMLIDEDAASVAVRKRYDEIKRAMDMPFVGTTFCALARWPDFLATYWSALKNVLQSPMYHECAHGVKDTAWALTRELPGSFELTIDQLGEAGMRDEDVASVVRITELFVKSLSGLVLNVALAKIGLEGGTKKLAPTRQPSKAGTPQQAA